MSDDPIDWEELARVMREEHKEEAIVLLELPGGGPNGERYECLTAPSRMAYLRAKGYTTFAAYVVKADDGTPDYLIRLAGLRDAIRKLDAERGWT